MSSLLAVFPVLARVLIGFAFAFVVPLAWSSLEGEQALTTVWTLAWCGTLVSGWILLLATRRYRRELLPRDGFLLVNLVWVSLTLVSALPLMWAVPGVSFTDAFFEAMSALTATGATALTGLDDLPVSANVWRCFLQYVGGLGIILLVVAVLPMMGLGGMQLYRAEAPGPMKNDRLTPRIAETARGLWTVYFVLSIACLLAYRWAGMTWADAFMHMCTTMGLGGFSSHDASFGYWNSPAIELVGIVFMSLAGISFVRYFIAWRARSFAALLRDPEVRAYATTLLAAIALLSMVLLSAGVYPSWPEALRASAFQVVSLATTTGYASTDYALWPVFAPVLLIFLGCFVSCAGSTGGGIKMVRMLLLVKQARRELIAIIHPRAVNPVTLGRAAIPVKVIAAVMAYMLMYGATIVLLSMLMLLTGLDLVTAFSAVIVSVNNIGPGLGQVGPASNFGVLTDVQTWICTVGMLLGRLELLSVLVMFTTHF